MTRWITCGFLLAGLLLATTVAADVGPLQVTAWAQENEVPDYEGEFFSDLTHGIPARQRVEISRTLRNAAQASRIHPMLVVIDRMADYPAMPQSIDGFATKLANEWKIGDQKTNKGILVLFALKDRKFFIAKTSNLSQQLTDRIKQAMGGRMTASLKAGKVDRAMRLAADAIAEQLPVTGADGAPTQATNHRTRSSGARPPARRVRGGSSFAIGGWLCPLIMIGLIVAVVIGVMKGARHGYGGGYGGGYYGGGGGGGGFLGGMLTGGLLGYMFGGGMGHHGYGGSHWGGHDYGGSDYGGSDFGGSDFGGGDFGGGFDSFGGGDFDGGGSFGEW